MGVIREMRRCLVFRFNLYSACGRAATVNSCEVAVWGSAVLRLACGSNQVALTSVYPIIKKYFLFTRKV